MEVILEGKKVHIRTPKDAKHAGMALVPEDRKREGLILPFSVESNITMASLDRLTKGGILDSSKEKEIADRQVEALAVKTPSTETKVDQPFRRQPAEMYCWPLVGAGSQDPGSSTSLPAASTSAPNMRSTF